MGGRAPWKCPNCRHQALLDLPEFGASLICDGYLKKFSASHQEIIKTMTTRSRLYKHYFEQSKTVDPLSCSNCQRKFWDNKRLRCGGCRKVFYCSKECQVDNWTRCHKPWCRMFALVNEVEKKKHDNSMMEP